MVKVVQVVPKLNVGGLQKVCIGLSNELQILGHKVDVVSLSDVDQRDSLVGELSSGIGFFTLRRNDRKVDVGIFYKLYSLLKKQRPEVVHTHGISLFYLMFFVMFNSNVRFIHTIHNVAHKDGGRVRRYIQGFLFKFLGVRAVVLSPMICKTFRECYGFEPYKVIGNASVAIGKTSFSLQVQQEIDALKFNSETLVLINVARISAQKNQVLLLQSFKRLIKQKYNVVLVILGDYSDLTGKKLKAQLNELADGLPAYFLGNKFNVGDYLLAADVFCLSSVFEGFPISILEAFSCGLPVVSTSVGGIPEILENDQLGVLAEGVDVESYTQALKVCISNIGNVDKDYIKEVHSKSYSYRSVASKYVEIYS